VIVIKALAVGLGLVLGAGVVQAQPKRAPKRKPPAAAPKSDAQPAATPTTPDPRPADGSASSPSAAPLLPAPTPPAPEPAAPAPGTAAPAPAGRAKPAPMKTDEKAAANEALQRHAAYKNVSKTDESCALTAFHKGIDLYNNGLFLQARERYHEALKCWDHPGIHYNLALALINLDQPVDVYEELNKAIMYGPEPLTNQDKFDHAKEYLKLVAGQLANIEVSCDKTGAKVAVDGKDVFVAPGSYKAKVRVGKHTFYGEKEGYNARVTAPFIGPGETFRIELKLYTIPELTRYRRRWDKTWMPYAVIGAGALVGLIGGGLELSADSTYKDLNSSVAKCNTATQGCQISNNQNLIDMQNSGNTKRTLGYVGYGVAGAAIATGALLVYLNRRTAYQISPDELDEEQNKGQDKAPGKAPGKAPAVSFTPVVSPGMAGALVQGHF
jgi:tetratricopeptide (TPR) repeat protein